MAKLARNMPDSVKRDPTSTRGDQQCHSLNRVVAGVRLTGESSVSNRTHSPTCAPLHWGRVAVALIIVACSGQSIWAEDERRPPVPLAVRLEPYLEALHGQQKQFRLQAEIEVPVDGRPQSVLLQLSRYSDQSFDLELTHADYAVSIRRRPDSTALALPKHQVVFVGHGSVDEHDQLAPRGILTRLLSGRTQVASYLPLVEQVQADAVIGVLIALFGVQYDDVEAEGTAGDTRFRFGREQVCHIETGRTKVRLQIGRPIGEPKSADDWEGLRTVQLERSELERQLARGVRRAIEILAPSTQLTQPAQTPRSVAHGQLRWIEGQRVVLLSGSPAEVGRAHGELLRNEAQACIDSVLYTFGTVQTIRTGRWFRHDLQEAYQRLAPHIPQRHKTETRAMAAAMGLDEQLAEALNVFPELFHCSGFAVFGKATRDGKLYHGRVLDYMTAIGLQDAATTFIVRVDGQIPFANVGYAGFIGSVSGMNARAISLGEMGGRGEGQWDGAPMATLMRRALEECETLDEVMALWEHSPRTCEYYYVFADGKTNRAVGVAATPESIEFVHPGQSHERLGPGIEDAVVLSAGSRLVKLRERVQAEYGNLDAELGQWLMSRPVAMQSNLHNVLFVPADGVLYVANADHKHPAAERPYVRLDLHQLLNSISSFKAPQTSSARD